MVRAGVVEHPSQWSFGGYYEIHNPKQRYTLINRQKLMDFLGIAESEQLCRSLKKWAEEILKSGNNRRDTKWTESIAIGSRQYVEDTQTKLGIKAKGRSIVENNGAYELRDPQTPYNHVFDPKKTSLRQNNSYFWGSLSKKIKMITWSNPDLGFNPKDQHHRPLIMK